MSQVAVGGGMQGSDDDGNGREKKGKGVEDTDYSPASSDFDSEGEQAEAGEPTRRSSLDCLAALEASLPMKRGISSHYNGRSKSFVNLSELGLEESKDLCKKEHAINKRRRLLIAHQFHNHKKGSINSSSSSASAMPYTSSLPAFPSNLHEHQEQEDEDDDDTDPDHNNNQHGDS